MSGIVNLESALRTCKVDTGYSNRIQSDRFLNPKNMVCPMWNGLDAAGRMACANSFYTKREGCNSAEDRVGVENVLRPAYMNYISLQTSAGGYNQNYVGVPEGVKMSPSTPTVEGYDEKDNKDFETPYRQYFVVTGNNGDLNGRVWPRTCAYDRYDRWSAAVLGK